MLGEQYKSDLKRLMHCPEGLNTKTQSFGYLAQYTDHFGKTKESHLQTIDG